MSKLVLGRKLNESIIINGDIKVTITEISRGFVRVCIDAPSGVVVDREEIHLRRQE